MSLYRIKRRGINHPVQRWAKQRGVEPGTLFPAPCPLSDKPGGKKGKPVAYDDKKLKELLLLNGNNYAVFRFATRIGGWLFNPVSNKHLIPKLKGLLWWQNNYVPFPLPKGKKAFAENIVCDGNEADVDKVKGSWVHIKPGIALLTQVYIGSDLYQDTRVLWKHPGGWLPKDFVEKA